MIKKIRNDGIFKKPEIQKVARTKKVSNKDKKKNIKNFIYFLLSALF